MLLPWRPGARPAPPRPPPPHHAPPRLTGRLFSCAKFQRPEMGANPSSLPAPPAVLELALLLLLRSCTPAPTPLLPGWACSGRQARALGRTAPHGALPASVLLKKLEARGMGPHDSEWCN